MAAENEPRPEAEKEKGEKLPAEFWAELLDLPQCKIDGRCNGCGRCEH